MKFSPLPYDQAVKETGIEPVDRPELDIVQIGKRPRLYFHSRGYCKNQRWN